VEVLKERGLVPSKDAAAATGHTVKRLAQDEASLEASVEAQHRADRHCKAAARGHGNAQAQLDDLALAVPGAAKDK